MLLKHKINPVVMKFEWEFSLNLDKFKKESQIELTRFNIRPEGTI